MSSNTDKINSKGKGTRLSIVLGRGFSVIILITLITGIVSIAGLMNTDGEYQGLIEGAVELDEDSKDMSISYYKQDRLRKILSQQVKQRMLFNMTYMLRWLWT